MAKNISVKKLIRNIVMGILLIFIIIILNSAGILTYVMVNKRADFKNLDLPENYNITSQNISLLTSDNFNIDTYEVESTNPKGYIIILSGIYSPSVTTYYGYAKMFKDLGYSSILVEMRAHGKSDGNKIMLGYTEENDVNAAVDYIDSKYKDIPIIVFGTSMGGTVAINSAANNNRINGVISQSAFSSWEENMKDLFESFGLPRFIASIQIPFTKLLLGFKYGFKNIKNTPSHNINKIDSNYIMLLHSEDDSQVKYQNFERLFNIMNRDVESYIVSGDKHFILETEEEFVNPTLNEEYYKAIKSFLDKF